MATVTTNQVLKGYGIYTDSKRRTIYYDRFRKKAWYIPVGDFRQFNLLKNRFVFTAAAFLLLFTVSQDWFKNIPFWLVTVISLAIYAWMEYAFQNLLNHCQPVKKLQLDRLTPTVSASYGPADRGKVLAKCALFTLLGILIVLNAFQQGYTGWTLWLCYGVCIYCIGYSLYLIYRLITYKADVESSKK